MRVAFDHQAFCLQRAGGISRYYARLANELFLSQTDVGIFAPLHRNQYLQQLPIGIVRGKGVKNYLPRTAGALVWGNGIWSRAAIRSWKPTIVHETFYSGSRSAPKQCPTVVTVFDMISERLRAQDFSKSYDFKKSAKYSAVMRADHVICISEHTRIDLLDYFDLSEKKVSVVHLGCERFTSNNTYFDTASSNKRPYLLFVGERGGYKNFDGLLSAFAQSKSLVRDFDIVAAGGGPFSTREQSLIHLHGLSMGQIRQQAVDDSQLGRLYAGAAALIYPSKYEGFGLPPLEAMLYDCPVISSNYSSMPEVIGDAGEYFDPTLPESIIHAIVAVVYDDKRQNTLRIKGRIRAKRFTWEACASNTVAAYESIVQSA